jgi:hypothetical protein
MHGPLDLPSFHETGATPPCRAQSTGRDGFAGGQEAVGSTGRPRDLGIASLTDTGWSVSRPSGWWDARPPDSRIMIMEFTFGRPPRAGPPSSPGGIIGRRLTDKGPPGGTCRVGA